MVDFPLVDTLIAVIVVISAIIGWVRGGTREILSVIALVGSVYITISLLPYTRDVAKTYVSHALIADFAASCVLFILSLTILSLLNYCFSNFVKKSALKTADKALGVTFGITRAVVILAVVDFVLGQFVFSSPQKLMEESRIRPVIANISNFIVLILPDGVQDEILSRMSQLKKQSLLDFVSDNLPKYAPAPTAEEHRNKVVAVGDSSHDEDIDDNGAKTDVSPLDKKELTAEDIATLKPRKDSSDQSGGAQETKGGRKRKDMDRFLGAHGSEEDQ
jgi:membrane protein required for colicin V production